MRDLSNHRCPGPAGVSVLGPSPCTKKKFYPWFFANDDRRWKRVATRFLLLATVAALVLLLVLLVVPRVAA